MTLCVVTGILEVIDSACLTSDDAKECGVVVSCDPEEKPDYACFKNSCALAEVTKDVSIMSDFEACVVTEELACCVCVAVVN